jgi:phosphonate transport system substrate-binding protein
MEEIMIAIRSIAAIFCLGISAAAAAQQAEKKAMPAQSKVPPPRLVFAVSEGTSGGIETAEAIAKYRPFANLMEKALGKAVVVTFVRKFEALEAGLKSGEFDLAMARPSDYPARAVRDNKYKLVATAKPDGQCFFIVEKSSPLQKLDDAKGKNILFPEQIAFMTKFCTAELRDRGFNLKTEKIAYAKEQGAVGWSIENKGAEVGGVASYSGVAKNWEKNGHRVLHKSIPQPFSPLIAGRRITDAQVTKLQTLVAEMDKNEDGKKALTTMGIQGFTPEGPDRLLALLAWLEKK